MSQLLNSYQIDPIFLNKDFIVKTMSIHLISLLSQPATETTKRKKKSKDNLPFFLFSKAINLICFKEKIN